MNGDLLTSRVRADSCFSSAIGYLVLLLIVLSSNTVYSRTDWCLSHSTALKIILLATSFLLLFTERNRLRKKISPSALVYVLITVVFCCLLVPMGSTFASVAIAFGPYVVFSLVASLSSDISDLIKKLISVVFLLACGSLLFFLLGTTLHMLNPSGYVTIEWGGLRSIPSYGYLYFETQTLSESLYEGVRNTGIFSEAPMFSYVLSFAFAWNVLIQKGSNFVSAILGVTILTTFSTTGYVVLAIVGLACLLSHKFNSRLFESLRLIAVPILIIAITILVLDLLGAKVGTGSYSVRSDHLMGCLELIKSSFPFGIGFGDTQIIKTVISYDQGMSVGLPYFVARGGIIACIVFFVPWVYVVAKSIYSKEWSIAAFAFVLLWVFFVTQIISVSSIMCLFLFGSINALNKKVDKA